MKIFSELESNALHKLRIRKHELGLSHSEPLSKAVFTEVLNSGGILYRHGVLARRLGIDQSREAVLIEEFVQRVADLGNLGVYATYDERRLILHPPFESFAQNALAQNEDVWPSVYGRGVVASAGNVVHVNFVALDPISMGSDAVSA